MKTKICPRCKQEKEIKEFSIDNNRKFGIYPYCKKCSNQLGKEYRLKNIDIIKEKYLQNKDKINKRRRDLRRKYRYKYWAKKSIQDHRYKGYIININENELIQLAKTTINCPICNMKLKWDYVRGNNINSPTLDRKDNEKKLNIHNIQIICWKCNTTKLNRTMSEFIDYCGMVYKKFNK